MNKKQSSSGNGLIIGFIILLIVVGSFSFPQEYLPYIAGGGGALLLIAIIRMIMKKREVDKLSYEVAQRQKEEQERQRRLAAERARREAEERERAAAARQAGEQKEKAASSPAEPSLDIEVPEEINGAECAYQYEKVYFDLLPEINPESFLGRKVRFDDVNGDIFVKVGSKKIGTMRSNRLSDMVSDWLERGDPIFAVITSVNDDPMECAFDLFLYKKEKWDDE